jgi:Flp pilus assembly protein TadG
MLKKNQKGLTAIEFVIIVPLIFLFIFGAIDFSLLLYNKAMITNASREGARVGVVFNTPDRIPQARIRQVANHYCKDNLISFGNLNYNDVEVDPPTVYPCIQGNPITVKVSCDYHFLFIPIGPISLSADTVMVCE